MIERIKGLFADEEGATMAEYALLLGLIAVACIFALTDLGTAISDKFREIIGKLNPS